MNGYDFSFCGAQLTALGSGALWWADAQLLCVSDLHLGKSERILRRGGTALPPYDTLDTLNRLTADLERLPATRVICLGDSFDDTAAGPARRISRAHCQLAARPRLDVDRRQP